MKLTPKSKTKYLYSKTATPKKTKRYIGRVNVKQVAIKTKPAKKATAASFSPLKKGNMMYICDAILSKAGNPWYYIYYNGHYGYVPGAYVNVEVLNPKVKKFLNYLETYHKYIKAHGGKFYYHYDGSLTTFSKAKKKKSKVGITCVVPIRWAMAAMGIKRSNGSNIVQAVKGTFAGHYTGSVTKNFIRIRSGAVVGKSVKQAVDAGLLEPGDIIAFKGFTHTFAYTGNKYYMYEGGHANIKNGHYPNGIMPDYSKHYTNRRISEILRWR